VPVLSNYRFILKELVALVFVTLVSGGFSYAQDYLPYYYDIGTPSLSELYVDPERGSDSNTGTTRSAALRTVTAAWSRIPSSQTLTTGYRINLLPGSYGDDPDETPSYWELKRGTYAAPIILRAADGQGTVLFTTDINMANVSYFYLFAVTIMRGGDTFHCEACDHILLRGNTLIGAPNGRTVGAVAHETVKVNQSQYIYLENNLIKGAEDNAIDWVAVQYGHIVANKVSDSQSWCTYVKGGSAYIRIEANEFSDCFEGGVTAGQGTGLEYMVTPWLRYEAYDVKIINNLIHDIDGAALGVNGGYNILLAHNTAYRIGSRSHLVEIIFGSRTCDENGAPCLSRVNSGGWGPTDIGGDFEQPIGNRSVKVLNNILYNPPGSALGDQIFAVYGPRTPTVAGIPSPQRTDNELEIRGNLIWGGGASFPLGIEGTSEGCQPSHSTCNETQLRADNFINLVEPDFVALAAGDLRPVSGGAITALAPAELNSFTARSGDEVTPEGVLFNSFGRDRSGAEVATARIGAYSDTATRLDPPGNPVSTVPQAPRAPAVAALVATQRKVRGRYRVSVRCSVRSSILIASVSARLSNGKRFALRKRRSVYSAEVTLRSKARLTVTVSATDSGGMVTTSQARVR
jgi:hypothetical protein